MKKQIAKILLTAKAERGITLDALSENSKVSRNTVIRILKGKKDYYIENAEKIFDYFDININLQVIVNYKP